MLRSKCRCKRLAAAVYLSLWSLLLSAIPAQAQEGVDNLPCSTRRTAAGCLTECASNNDNYLFECSCLWDFDTFGFTDCPEGETCCHNMPCEKWTSELSCVRGGGGGRTSEFLPKNCTWHAESDTCACTPPLVHSKYDILEFIIPNGTVLVPPFDCSCPFTTDEQWNRLGVCNPPGVRKLEVKLNFAKPLLNDSISFEGSLSIPDNFVVNAAVIDVNIGGITKSFTLDSRGKARNGNDQVQLTVKTTHGVVPAQQAKLSVKFDKGTLAAQFVDDGLVNQTVTNVPVSIPIEIQLNDAIFAKTHGLTYSAKAGKTGKTK